MECNGCEVRPELYYDPDFQIWARREEDGNLAISDCNRAFTETLGYSREELKGQPLSELHTEDYPQQLCWESLPGRA